MSVFADEYVGAMWIDNEGKVMSFTESMATLGLSPECVGRPWKNALPNLQADKNHAPHIQEAYRLEHRGESYEVVVLPHRARGTSSVLVRRLNSADALRDLARRLDKQATLTDLVAGIAHEINNPLTCISGWLQLLLDDAKTPQGQPTEEAATLRMLLEEAGRVSRIVSNLLNYARPSRPRRELIRLDYLLAEILELVEYQMRNRNIVIERRIKGPIPSIVGDPAAFKQVFLNLIINAKHAMPEGGRLVAEVGAADDEVYVRIEDSGVGIAPENAERVFERGFTTRGGQGGTGLGLPVAKEIVEAHGGTIRVESEPGRGAAFTLTLPAYQHSENERRPMRRWLETESAAAPTAAAAADTN